jgi:hypothetical protein
MAEPQWRANYGSDATSNIGGNPLDGASADFKATQAMLHEVYAHPSQPSKALPDSEKADVAAIEGLVTKKAQIEWNEINNPNAAIDFSTDQLQRDAIKLMSKFSAAELPNVIGHINEDLVKNNSAFRVAESPTGEVWVGHQESLMFVIREPHKDATVK